MSPGARRRQYGTGSITRRPDGKWLGRLEAGFTVNGTRRRIAVVAASEAECKRRLRDKRLELEVEGPGAITTTRPTVKAWSETWLADYQRHARPKTYATDASIMRKWIVPSIGHRRLADLTPADVRKVTDAVREAGRTTTTAGYAQSILNRMLKAAIVEGHQVHERVLLTPKPAAAVSDRTAIPLADAIALLERASTKPDGSRWVAALLQGMRQAECLGLTWAAVDLDATVLGPDGEPVPAPTVDVSWQLQALPYADRQRGTFRVPDGYEVRQLEGGYHLTRPKTARGQRKIPLVPWMHAALLAWREIAPKSPHGLVWPRTDGAPRDTKSDREAWYALQTATRVRRPGERDRYLLHEARHTTATLLLQAGVEPEVIKDILGHSSIVTSRGYMHTDDAMTRAALEAVAARLRLSA